MIERGVRLQEVCSAVETLLDNNKVKRLDGNGFKAYRMGEKSIRVDIEDLNKEEGK